MLVRENLVLDNMIAERDTRDDMGIQSVHVAPVSHVSHFARHGLWRWRTFSASCQEYR